MRKILLFIVMFAPLLTTAQATPRVVTFEQLEKKYTSREGYTVVSITESMLRMKRLERIQGVRELRIVTAEQPAREFTGDILSIVEERRNGYKLLSSTVENRQSFRFYFRPVPNSDPQRISELVMIQYGSQNNMIMVMRGDFSIQQIDSIAGGKVDIKM